MQYKLYTHICIKYIVILIFRNLIYISFSFKCIFNNNEKIPTDVNTVIKSLIINQFLNPNKLKIIPIKINIIVSFLEKIISYNNIPNGIYKNQWLISYYQKYVILIIIKYFHNNLNYLLY